MYGFDSLGITFVGLLVDRPNVRGSLAVSCLPSRYRPLWCGVTVSFPPGTAPLTRWALAVTSNVIVPAVSRGPAGASRAVTDAVASPSREPKSQPTQPTFVRSAGPVIWGTVGTTAGRLATAFVPRPDRAWQELTAAEATPYTMSLGVILPGPLQSVTNGIAVGYSPWVGFLGGSRQKAPVGYSISGLSGIWQPPAHPTYDLETFDYLGFPIVLQQYPRSVDPTHPNSWHETIPSQASWEWSDPTAQDAVRTRTFMAGRIVAIATSAFVGLVQAVIRPSART
jgi:hypothetical protein